MNRKKVWRPRILTVMAILSLCTAITSTYGQPATKLTLSNLQLCHEHKPDTTLPVVDVQGRPLKVQADFEAIKTRVPFTTPSTNRSAWYIDYSWKATDAKLSSPLAAAQSRGGRSVLFADPSLLIEVRVPPIYWIDCLKELAPDHSAPEWDATIFLGELRSYQRDERIVEVHWPVSPLGTRMTGDKLEAWIVSPGDDNKPPSATLVHFRPLNFVEAKLVPDDHHPFRLWEGEKDSADPSHFTIRYLMADKSGVIDGWLTDEDEVALVYRNGPAAKMQLGK